MGNATNSDINTSSKVKKCMSVSPQPSPSPSQLPSQLHLSYQYRSYTPTPNHRASRSYTTSHIINHSAMSSTASDTPFTIITLSDTVQHSESKSNYHTRYNYNNNKPKQQQLDANKSDYKVDVSSPRVVVSPRIIQIAATFWQNNIDSLSVERQLVMSYSYLFIVIYVAMFLIDTKIGNWMCCIFWNVEYK